MTEMLESWAHAAELVSGLPRPLLGAVVVLPVIAVAWRYWIAG